MPRSSRENVETVSHYSRFTGWIYIFNLIVGTGALTLPAAFHDAGWLPSTVIIVLLAFISYLTATFVIESMASANALMHHRRLQRFKKSSHSEQHEIAGAGGSTEVRIVPAEESSDSGRASPSNFHYVNQQTDDESEPLLSDTSDINLQRHGYSEMSFAITRHSIQPSLPKILVKMNYVGKIQTWTDLMLTELPL